MNPRFSLGIDLGTSNCAMAVADNDSDSTDVLPVTQIVAANQVGEMRTLPSALYLPHPEEFPAGSFRLPWDAAGPGIVGQFARDHGALVPDRLVASAKSWLSNPHIDPKQRTLPWRSDIAEEKLSPFECSSRYLQHLKVSFLHSMHRQGREWDLGDGQVVLTVPACFDEVARSLTRTRPRPPVWARSCCWRNRKPRSTPGPRRLAASGAMPSRPATSSWCATSAAVPQTSA